MQCIIGSDRFQAWAIPNELGHAGLQLETESETGHGIDPGSLVVNELGHGGSRDRK